MLLESVLVAGDEYISSDKTRISQGGQKYDYGAVATRSPARFRDAKCAHRCLLAVVEVSEMPCGGHTSPPLTGV